MASSKYSDVDDVKHPYGLDPSRALSVWSGQSQKSSAIISSSLKSKSADKRNIATSDVNNVSKPKMITPSVLVSASDSLAPKGRPKVPQEARIRSQTVKASRWSESSAAESAAGGGIASSRVNSMASASSLPGRSKSANTKTSKANPDLHETLVSPRPISLPEALSNDASHASMPERTSKSSLTSMMRRLDNLDFGNNSPSK